MKELNKVYDPKSVEDKIYKLWTDGGYFEGTQDPDKKPFTIVIPPPNVTGQLHLGHALNNTLQDILIRYKRMNGFAALWIPGTDHAGIATQARVEKVLRSEGLSRHDLGRERFLERVWEWKNTYGNIIIDQLKKLGSSCDWSRERFTMDEGCSKAVREVFVALYEKGLIYKGNRIINWCPNCITALSDIEIEHDDKAGSLWHIKYPVKDSDEYIVVATTRPETMLGDTAVAVNPKDKRYKHLIGKFALLPLTEREIPIIADEYVDMEFGSGCVKITPCHDPNDFEIGQRHNLLHVLMLDENAKVINSGKYDGLDRYDARHEVLSDLEALALIAKTEEHNHSIGSCHRCNTVVEPIASEQWFVKMKPLTKDALSVVEDGTIKFVPERFTKIYTHWMDNVRDWCISRQLWWGHRIPAWYCDCGYITVSRTDPKKCDKCNSSNIWRDEDVLDTWFSSALWPFSTLGWPDETEDLKYFYPTDVLVTGYEIIFFWVARMIFSGMEFMKKEPFHTVFLNGMIRDSQGRIMSKSLGNGIDPLEVIDKYGADALRFKLITAISPGNDSRFNPERCEAMRNFANKIWNASRFVMMNLSDNEQLEGGVASEGRLPDTLELEDKWILSKLNTLVYEVNENLDKFEIGVAGSKIYDFIWDTYCDWYIELVKPRLQLGTEKGSNAENAQKVLLYVLEELLALLHPFMPFITEEIWQALPRIDSDGPALMIRSYPKFNKSLCFQKEESEFESIMAVIRAVRSRRAEMNVPPSKRPTLTILTDKTDIFEAGRAFIGRLAYASDVIITKSPPADLEGLVSVTTNDARMFIPLAELVDLSKERERIEKEIAKARSVIEQTEKKLQNEQFVSKAPEHVITTEREKLSKSRALLENLLTGLESL